MSSHQYIGIVDNRQCFTQTKHSIFYSQELAPKCKKLMCKILIKTNQFSVLLKAYNAESKYIKQAMIAILVLFLNAFLQGAALQQIHVTEWEFTVTGHFDDKWFPSSVPSTIHIDLLQNKLIEDPFFGNSEDPYAWIHSAYFTYRTNFSIPASWNFSHHDLVFEGIDTYGKVLLNGKELLRTNNSFVKWTVSLDSSLLQAVNTIQIQLTPSRKMDQQADEKIIKLPFSYGHSRKPSYHYGWDWAPKLITAGVSKPVWLMGYDKLKIEYVWVRDKLVGSKLAILDCAIVLNGLADISAFDFSHEIQIFLEGESVAILPVKQSNLYKQVQIVQPRLWWPINIGTPHVYHFSFLLKHKSTTLQSVSVIHGIRTIQLNQTDGAFQFIVNGYPVYAKGANYVPPDMFHPSFTNSRHHNNNTPSLQQLVDTMVESNFNMVRVWGGGQYQTDQFYELLSRKGILVFQDFMFSVNIYPANVDFLRSVEMQVKQQTRRLRNYPCIAIWSGNNQVLQGVLEWGWKSDEYRQSFTVLFQNLIAKIVEIESPDISYISSSPAFGSGMDVTKGDIHYWQVWAGSAPFENYNQVVGRFNSEFGTQSFPVWETTKLFSKRISSLNYSSPEVAYHQKHKSEFNFLAEYIERYSHKSINFEMEVFQSGLVQANALAIAISAQRTQRQMCWGTLYWQMNDAWPAISWSSLDYFGRWKPLQYLVKRLYSDVAILFRSMDGGVGVWIVNDRLWHSPVKFTVRILKLNGDVLLVRENTVIIEANTATRIYEFSKQYLLALNIYETELREICFFGEAVYGKDAIMRNTYYAGSNKIMKWQEHTRIQVRIAGSSIVLKSDSVIRSLYISHRDRYLKLSDNYFDVVPGITYTVTCTQPLEAEKDSIVFQSYVQSYSDTMLVVQYLHQKSLVLQSD